MLISVTVTPKSKKNISFKCNYNPRSSEINIKKVQKQDLKNIKNVKGCRDGMPKSVQTRSR